MNDSLFCRICGVQRPYQESLRSQYKVAKECLIKLGSQLDEDHWETEHCDGFRKCDMCGIKKNEGSSHWFWVCVMVTTFGAKTIFEQGGLSLPVKAALGLCAALSILCGAILPGLPTSVCSSPWWRVVSKVVLNYLLLLTFLLYQGIFSRCLGLYAICLHVFRSLMWTPLSIGVAYDAMQYMELKLPFTDTFTSFGDLTCLALAVAYMEFLLDTDFGYCQHYTRLSTLALTVFRASPGLCMFFYMWGKNKAASMNFGDVKDD